MQDSWFTLTTVPVDGGKKKKKKTSKTFSNILSDPILTVKKLGIQYIEQL